VPGDLIAGGPAAGLTASTNMHPMRRAMMIMMATVLGLTTAVGPAAAAPARGIPQRVMLQPADLGGAVPGPVEEGLRHSLLPQPCADTPVPQPAASRSLAADYGTRYRIYENVARYRRGGAEAYMAALKEQLARCRAGGDEEGYTAIAEDHLGPGTVLFLGTYDEGDRWAAYVAAVVDRYVLVVVVTDRVTGGGDPTTANGLASAAMRRATQAHRTA
jgi:hypothetical protein